MFKRFKILIIKIYPISFKNIQNINAMNNSFIIGVELTPEMNRFLAYWRSLLSFLKEYVFMLIVAFNLITNSINFFIFMKPNFKKVSVSFYLTLLSLSNIVASYVVIFFMCGGNYILVIQYFRHLVTFQFCYIFNLPFHFTPLGYQFV